MEPRQKSTGKKHLIIILLIAVLVSGGLAYIFLHFDFIPFSDSLERQYIDKTLRILFSIGSAVFGILITFFTYSLIVFRKRRGDESPGSPNRGLNWLEIMWTVVPLIIVSSLSVYGANTLVKMTAPASPNTELEIDVTAFRFGWQFQYPEYGIKSFELGVPVNRRIHLLLQSKDVVHSFWVQQWGVKQDAVPGLTTEVRYTPVDTGQFLVQCSQLCGYGHTYMTAPVSVMSQSDFAVWASQQQKIIPSTTTTTASTSTTTTSSTSAVTFQAIAESGKTVYSNSCAVCHGSNGQGGVGPPLWGPNATPGKYAGTTLFDNNAQAMLNFISKAMPLSAPGSLTHEQYIDVLGYILIQDHLVSSSNIFNESQLGSITIK